MRTGTSSQIYEIGTDAEIISSRETRGLPLALIPPWHCLQPAGKPELSPLHLLPT